MNKLSIPPLSSSKRSRDKSRDVSRSHWISSLSLDMMSKLTLVSDHSSPPSSSSSRSRDKSGDVSRSQWNSSLSLASVMSKLTSMNIESIPPLSSSKRSRDKSRDVSRGHWISSSLTPLSYGHMVDIAEGVVVTGQFSRCCDRSLRSTSRSEAVLV